MHQETARNSTRIDASAYLLLCGTSNHKKEKYIGYVCNPSEWITYPFRYDSEHCTAALLTGGASWDVVFLPKGSAYAWPLSAQTRRPAIQGSCDENMLFVA